MIQKRDAVQFEVRRHEAVSLWKRGVSQADIARRFGVSAQSVCKWIQRYRQKGPKGLARKPRPGRPAKLTALQRKRLVRLLLRGPVAAGYVTELWTSERVVQLILDTFEVRFHPHHIPKLLRQCGWTPQKPVRKALERNERKIRRWMDQEWPRIKKKFDA